MDYSKKNVITNLIWKFSEKAGIQVVNLIIQIFLTRLLLPADYANVAIIMVFVQLANLVVQSGFGSALVQKESVDSKDYSSVFFLCSIIAVVIYILIFICAPSIAKFYKLESLSSLLRVQAIIVFPCAINTVQIAYLSRRMLFSKNFYASVVASIISGIGGITCAYIGLGIWSLIVCNVLNQITLTIALWGLIKWRPTAEFSIKRGKELFVFGWKLLVSSVLNMFYGNLQTLVIGKVFSKTMLGYYNRGELLGTTIMASVNNAISSVMLPVLSRVQNEREKLKQMYRRILSLDCFFSFPIMFGLASVAEPLITILFTEKWLPAVPFMIMVCISRALDPIHVTNLEALLAIGKSDITLKLEIIKKVIGVIFMIITFQINIYVFVFSNIVLSIISTVINSYPNVKNFNYTFKEQLNDICPYFINAFIMFCINFGISTMDINVWFMLVLQIAVGVIFYVSVCWIFKLEAFVYVLDHIKIRKSIKKK